jgi:hypothetical protein
MLAEARKVLAETKKLAQKVTARKGQGKKRGEKRI